MLKRSVTVVLVGGALIAAASQPAHAADVYPGLMCERWQRALGAVGDYGSTDNFSTDWSFVECPIVKNTALGTTVRYAIPYVIDGNSSDNARCTLWTAIRTPTGYYPISTAHVYSSGSSGRAQALTSGPLTSPSNVGGSEPTWFVYCELPPNSSIVNYIIGEQ